jgi:hypothetical protein
MANASSFYTRTTNGVLRCRICHARQGAHEPDCPLMAEDVDYKELIGQLGLFVATARELLERIQARHRGPDG